MYKYKQADLVNLDVEYPITQDRWKTVIGRLTFIIQKGVELEDKIIFNGMDKADTTPEWKAHWADIINRVAKAKTYRQLAQALAVMDNMAESNIFQVLLEGYWVETLGNYLHGSYQDFRKAVGA